MFRSLAVPIGGRPFWRWLILITVSLAVILVVLFAVEPWAATTIHEQTIANAYASMDSVNSYRFHTSSTALDLSTGSMINTQSEGAVVLPNSHQQRDTRDITLEGSWRTRDIIIIGEKSYLRYDDNDWNADTSPKVAFQIPGPVADLDILGDLQILPAVLVRGVVCTHFIGTLDLRELSSQFPEVYEGIEITIEIWIGEEDSLPRRSELSLQFLKEPQEIFGEGTNSVILVSEITEFYDYDLPIDILPPIP